MKLTDEYVKFTFGNEYSLVWNGHSHFADDISGDRFYICKREKELIPVHDFRNWYDVRHTTKSDRKIESMWF